MAQPENRTSYPNAALAYLRDNDCSKENVVVIRQQESAGVRRFTISDVAWATGHLIEQGFEAVLFLSEPLSAVKYHAERLQVFHAPIVACAKRRCPPTRQRRGGSENPP